MNDEDGIDTFVSILKKGGKSNTYKFALARYILEHTQKLSPETIQDKISKKENVIITYDEIAKGFLRYYWHQECKYKIIQNFDKNNPPKVISVINNIFDENDASSTLAKLKKDPIQKHKIKLAQKNICKEIFINSPNVIPRFQNIKLGGKAIQKEFLYKDDHKNRQIEIKFSALNFLNKNHACLINTTTLEWAKFLEKTNTLPKLINKIDAMEKKRTSLRKYIKIFKDFDHCFYCRENINNSKKHVDHFIPWSYIFEDDAWNLVISCQKCNCKKSDSLSNKEYLEKLIERNDRYQNHIKELEKSLYNIDTERGWEKEIEIHYSRCKEHGFTQIPLP